jgi:hypothetical protein
VGLGGGSDGYVVLRSSIATLWEVEYEQDAMLAVSYIVGMLLYMIEDATKIAANESDSALVVVSEDMEDKEDMDDGPSSENFCSLEV